MTVPDNRDKSGHDESGIALVTSLLIVMLCAIVVTAILQLATHTAQRSGLSRDRQAALDAAQAGVQAELATMSDGSCPTAGVETPLPDQNLPTESYIIQAPPAGSCPAVGGPAVIVSTGYVPNATKPTATTTIVAKVNRSRGAPVSGGANGGYDFPDAVFTDGAMAATAGAFNVFGSGSAIPNITADGPVTVTNSQLGGSVTGQGDVSLTGVHVGGNVASGGKLTLNNSTVTGGATYSTYAPTPPVTINGTTGAWVPVQARPLAVFPTNASVRDGDIQAALPGLGSSTTTACPGAGSLWSATPLFDIAGACASYSPSTFSPAAASAITVVIVQGTFKVDVPPTAVGGQLYVLDVGSSASDVLTINGDGSTLPVFAFTDGTLKLNGTFVGQVAGHSIQVTGPTTMTFTPPATPMPDLAFSTGYSPPTFSGPNPYVSTVSLQYQCPGATAC